MSKIERYAGNLRAFGSNAQGLERTLFGETTQADDLTSQVTSSFLRGWGIVGPSENPSMEDFNAAMYTMSQFIAYQHQMGIPEWDALQEYYSASICVRNGEAYLSLVDSNIGSAPPSAKWTSVLTAKNALANLSGFLKSSNNLSEIKDAGPVAVAQTLVNLGLGAGGFPIGMPFFWPSATLPNLLLPEWSNMVFLKFNNSSFSATTYPKLAQIFPSLVLPDARGNFPRIWDDGRGLDPGRVLLSQQGDAIRNFSGYIDAVYGQAAANRGGPFYNNAVSAERYNTTKSSGVDTYMNISFEPGRVVPVANENRPVNIAFNLLVRAA